MDRKALPVKMPPDLKRQLEDMAKDVGITQNNLTVIALHSLVVNYEKQGQTIFKELILKSERPS